MTTPPTAVSIHILPPLIKQKLHCQEASQETVTDEVSDYAAAILNDGLFCLNLKMQRDGPRILRCLIVLLLYFKFANHHYATQAF